MGQLGSLRGGAPSLLNPRLLRAPTLRDYLTPPLPRRLLPRESRAIEKCCSGKSAAAKTAVAAACATALFKFPVSSRCYSRNAVHQCGGGHASDVKWACARVGVAPQPRPQVLQTRI